MANPNKYLAMKIDASENLPHHYKYILPWGKRLVNSFLSKIIFISYLKLSPRMWMRIILRETNDP